MLGVGWEDLDGNCELETSGALGSLGRASGLARDNRNLLQ